MDVLLGNEASKWLNSEYTQFKELLSQRHQKGGLISPMMADGGLPVKGVLQKTDEDTWQEFSSMFLE